jgi:hypothetical protein
MTEENKVPPGLTDELKQKWHVKFTLDVQDEFNDIAKTTKGRFSYILKD